jgi:hypothetical protein
MMLDLARLMFRTRLDSHAAQVWVRVQGSGVHAGSPGGIHARGGVR